MALLGAFTKNQGDSKFRLVDPAGRSAIVSCTVKRTSLSTSILTDSV